MQKNIKTVTLEVGETKTPAIELMSQEVALVITDANLTGTALTFEVAEAVDGSFVWLKDTTGADVSVTVTTSKGYALSPSLMYGTPFVKIVSGTTQATNDSVFTIVTRNV